jgi:hypothetical protein
LKLPDDSPLSRSARFQPAVSPISNRQTVNTEQRFRTIRDKQAGSLRHSGLATRTTSDWAASALRRRAVPLLRIQENKKTHCQLQLAMGVVPSPALFLGKPLTLGIVFGIFGGLLYFPDVPLNAAYRSLCTTSTRQTLAASRATCGFLNFPLGFLESPSCFIFYAWLHKSAIELTCPAAFLSQ